MAYGALREPGYEARLEEEKAAQAARAQEAQAHVAALLRGAQAQEAVSPLLARLVAALERIAAAQERAHPVAPPPAPPAG